MSKPLTLPHTLIITVVTGSNPQPQGIDNHSLSDQNTPFARSLINSKL